MGNLIDFKQVATQIVGFLIFLIYPAVAQLTHI